MADPVLVSLNIALVPSKAKRCMWYLDYKEIKVGVGRQPPHFNVHNFDRADELTRQV